VGGKGKEEYAPKRVKLASKGKRGDREGAA